MMKMSNLCRLAIVPLVWAFALTVPIFAADPLSTRADALGAAPKAFDSKLVEITAYVSTGRHFSVLLDQPDSNQGVALLIPETARWDAAVKELMRCIYLHPREFMSHKVRGTFTGTFEWRPGVVPSRVLLFEHLEGLEIIKAGA